MSNQVWVAGYVAAVVTGVVAVALSMMAMWARYGSTVPYQRVWGILAGLSSAGATLSSAYFYPDTWRHLLTSLQVVTLPTLLAGVAAVGVLLQWYRTPYVYATIDPSLSRQSRALVLAPRSSVQLELHVFNCSNVTAHDIVVQGALPPPVRIQSINAPVFQWIDHDTNQFEMHLDSDQSYNPLHPHVSFTLRLNLAVGELPGPHPVVLRTMARNMRIVGHTFVLATQHEHVQGRRIDDLIRKKRLPLAEGPERLLAFQRIVVVLQAALTAAPWILRHVQRVVSIQG